jgi:hypothetical protein
MDARETSCDSGDLCLEVAGLAAVKTVEIAVLAEAHRVQTLTGLDFAALETDKWISHGRKFNAFAPSWEAQSLSNDVIPQRRFGATYQQCCQVCHYHAARCVSHSFHLRAIQNFYTLRFAWIFANASSSSLPLPWLPLA